MQKYSNRLDLLLNKCNSRGEDWMERNLIVDISHIETGRAYFISKRSIQEAQEDFFEETFGFGEKFLQNGEIHIPADEIKTRYFDDSQKYDVFISHSSRDTSEVYKYAEFLQNNGKEVFVDSMIWANYKDIVSTLVKDYNADSAEMMANLHIILASALSEVIEKSEYFLFIKSENSMFDENSVLSPWIYHELLIASKKTQKQIAMENRDYIPAKLKIKHDVKSLLKHFHEVEDEIELEKILFYQ